MIKTSLSALAMALSLGFVSSAEAQDWSGGYLTFGLSSASANLRLTSGEEASPQGASGSVAPYAASGYDWDTGDFSYGVLVDLDGMRVEDNLIMEGKGVLGEADMFATLRARVGVPVNDRMRVFASAGLAWMQSSSSNISAYELPPDSSRLSGKAAGLGMEYLLSPGRHLSVEYLYADFDAETVLEDSAALDPYVSTLRVGLTFRF